MNRSKVEEQGRNTWLFKEDFSPKSLAIEVVLGADLRHRWGDFTWRPRGFNPTANHLRFGGELALIVGRSGHDRTAIVSHDRG